MVECEIEPAAEFVAGVADVAAGLKAGLGMQCDAAGVFGIDDADHHMIALLLRSVDEPPEQLDGQETVLLSEDEAAVRTVAVAALERRGYRVLAAADGEGALALSRAFPGPIHLLVTDVVMPGMNGRELADRLTQSRPGVQVLYVSGYTEDSELLAGLSAETRSLLPKPFTSLELARRVRAALDGARESRRAPTG